jgi:hypothetical protein
MAKLGLVDSPLGVASGLRPSALRQRLHRSHLGGSCPGQGSKPASDVVVVNTSTAPVPVSVVNPPKGEPPFDPVTVKGVLNYPTGSQNGSTRFHTVPAGKWLIIEQVTFYSREDPASPADLFLVVVPPAPNQINLVSYPMAVDDRLTQAATMQLRQCGTKLVKIYAPPGADLQFADVKTMGSGLVDFTISGRYIPAP